jgi:hypothetical protein
MSQLNTEGYVVNTKIIEHILSTIESSIDKQEPIDIILDHASGFGTLKAYMPSMMFCRQKPEMLKEPIPWEGYMFVHGVGSHWDELLYQEFNGKY